MPRGGRKNAGDQQRQNDAPPGLEAVIAEHFGNDSMASLDSHLQNRNQRSQQGQQEAPAGVPNQQLPMDIPPPGFSQYGAPPPGLEPRFQPPPPLSSKQQNRGQNRAENQHNRGQNRAENQNNRGQNRAENQNNRQNNRQDHRNQNQQSSRNQHNRENQGPNEECILCCQRSDVFGLGQCRHPACMECIIRMRCLDESTKCHACRDDIQMIYFVRKPPNWDDYTVPECQSKHPDCEKFNICFEDTYTVDLYEKLNAHSCHVCIRNGVFADFPTFAALKQHIGAEHGLFFCHICLEHLNILPKNRRTFTDRELQLHMTGKKNLVQGVRGHPSCAFCNVRFFDDEELYKHSRKEHFYCSICADLSGLNSFFKHASQLHAHYKQKHHPCLHSDCVGLGIVYSNEFDLNIHKTDRHSENNRKIPIDFQFSRAQSRYDAPSSRLTNSSQGISVVPSNQPVPQPPTNIIPSAQFTNRNVNLVQRPTIVQQHDFPTLSSSNSSNAYAQGSGWRLDVKAARNQTTPRVESTLQEQIGSSSHFPTLGGPSSSKNSAVKNNVWNKGNAVDVIKKAPQKQRASSPKPQRKKIIPLPDIWPENMRRKLEARNAGLPEPEDLEPPLPQPPLEMPKKKKDKKPKKKTVGLETLKKRLNDQTLITEPKNTKFNLLSEID